MVNLKDTAILLALRWESVAIDFHQIKTFCNDNSYFCVSLKIRGEIRNELKLKCKLKLKK